MSLSPSLLFPTPISRSARPWTAALPAPHLRPSTSFPAQHAPSRWAPTAHARHSPTSVPPARRWRGGAPHAAGRAGYTAARPYTTRPYTCMWSDVSAPVYDAERARCRRRIRHSVTGYHESIKSRGGGGVWPAAWPGRRGRWGWRPTTAGSLRESQVLLFKDCWQPGERRRRTGA